MKSSKKESFREGLECATTAGVKARNRRNIVRSQNAHERLFMLEVDVSESCRPPIIWSVEETRRQQTGENRS